MKTIKKQLTQNEVLEMVESIYVSYGSDVDAFNGFNYYTWAEEAINAIENLCLIYLDGVIPEDIQYYINSIS